jgi:hypothetical protein
MEHRAQREGALHVPPAALNRGQLLVGRGQILAGEGEVGGAQQPLAVQMRLALDRLGVDPQQPPFRRPRDSPDRAPHGGAVRDHHEGRHEEGPVMTPRVNRRTSALERNGRATLRTCVRLSGRTGTDPGGVGTR